MFDPRDKQLSDFEAAYSALIDMMKGFAPENFIKPLGDWTPRDIAAHFISWNNVTIGIQKTQGE
jgi:hypothetical protein